MKNFEGFAKSCGIELNFENESLIIDAKFWWSFIELLIEFMIN
jgi:hypothetical protein